MDEFLKLLQSGMETPKPYSSFYFVFLSFVIVFTILISICFRNAKIKGFKTVLLITWIILVILEIIKEVVYSFYYDGEPKWKYAWSMFPFQLCSLPLYTLPILIFTNKDKHPHFFECILSFEAFTLLFAGLTVYINPVSVLCPLVMVNIQTMIHHGSQIIIGIFIICWYRKNINFNFFCKGQIVFVVAVAIASLLNLIVPNLINGNYFNMFYISPYYEFIVPGLNISTKQFPYILLLFGYIIGVMLSSFIVFLLAKLSIILTSKLFKKES